MVTQEKLSLTFSLTVRVAGLLISALVVLVVALCMQLVLRLLSSERLHPELPLLAFVFTFYLLSLFLTVGTRQRPAHAPSLLASLALHLSFLCVGWLLFATQLPPFGLAGGAACLTLVLVSGYSFDLLIERRVAKLFQPGVQGSEPLVQRCFFVDTPVHHALPIGAALGTLYGTLLGDPALPLAMHLVAGSCAALALAQLRELKAGIQLLRGWQVVSLEADHIVLGVDTSDDRCRLRAHAPAPHSPQLAAQVAHLAAAVRGARVLGQLQRMLVVTLCLLLLWRLELPGMPAWLVGGALALLGLLVAHVPYIVGQHATRARLQGAQAFAPIAVSPLLPGPVSLVLLTSALLLGALAFACLAPLSALAAR